MAVVSVDGLDVISGKAAEKSDKGYIVDAHSATEIKGYRLSDTERADFMFVSKDSKKNYVASAKEGDKRNSGVIGIRVFEEKPEKVKVVEKVKEIHHWHNNWIPKNPWNPYYPPYQPSYWYTTMANTGGVSYGTVTTTGMSSVITTSNTGGITLSGTATGTNLGGSVTGVYNASSGDLHSNVSYTAASGHPGTPAVDKSFDTYSSTRGAEKRKGGASGQSVKLSAAANSFDAPIEQDSFDTGTGWGHKNTDIVKKELFRKGKMVGELVLYYATTDALTNMGVDLSETPKIAEVPKAFGNSSYCQPPQGWNG